MDRGAWPAPVHGVAKSWTQLSDFSFSQGPDAVCVKSLQSCPTLCDPMDYGPLGSSVHGLLQAKILEWVAISSSRGSFQSRDWTHIFCIFCLGRQILYHWVTWGFSLTEVAFIPFASVGIQSGAELTGEAWNHPRLWDESGRVWEIRLLLKVWHSGYFLPLLYCLGSSGEQQLKSGITVYTLYPAALSFMQNLPPALPSQGGYTSKSPWDFLPNSSHFQLFLHWSIF